MNLSDWIDRWAGLAADRTAIRFSGRDVSYAGLAQMVGRLATVFESLGVQAGKAVGYLGFNSPEMLALVFACARVGAIFMPLNWRLAPPEHRQMLMDCTPVTLFAESRFVEQVNGIRDGLGAIRCVTFGEAARGWLAYDALVREAEGKPAQDGRIGYDAPVLVCYTSGSTGSPKGVVLSQNALLWNAVNSTHLHDMTSADRVLTTLPLFHVGGLNNQTLPALHAGAMVVLHARFEPDAVFDAIERQRVTLTVLVPAQLDMLMASPRWQSADLSSLRMITTGSCIIPDRILRAVHDRGIPLVQIYGSTETCPIATYLLPSDALRKAGSAGKPAVHCECRLVDEAGNDVPQGTTGEILVRGPNVMLGYWNKPEATAGALRDGWFHTDDMGHLDPEGYLFVDGRKKEMIISGGENIYPAELENILAECEDIAESSVVGRPDERWGEAVVAVVVRKTGRELCAADVLKLFDGRIARYKQPREVIFVKQLPRTALGKIRKEDVRHLVERESVA